MRYKTWQEFFTAHGNTSHIGLDSFGGETNISVEDLYQHFKTRMSSEFSASAREIEWIPVENGVQPDYPFGATMEVKFSDGEIVRATNPRGLRWGDWGKDTIVAYRPAPANTL